MSLFNHLVGSMSPLQGAVWSLYLLAAVTLPIHHVRPILKYLRGHDSAVNGVHERLDPLRDVAPTIY